MNILNNLMGNDSKINAEVIAALFEGNPQTLDTIINNLYGEVGENANGTYILLPNGVQICWAGYLGPSQTTGVAQGSSYVSGGYTWNFPAEFISRPALIPGGRRIAGGTAWGGHSGAVTESMATALRVVSTTNNTEGSVTPIAIGRWK